MTLRHLPRRAAFALGLSLSLLPAFGPFMAALLVFTRRWSFERRDLLWAAAAVLYGGAHAVSSGPLAAMLGVGTIVGPWVVFRTFAELERTELGGDARHAVGRGLFAGFVVVVAFGALGAIDAVDLGASRTVAGAIAWGGAPGLYGHTVLVLGGLIALLLRRQPGLATAAMALSATGIALSGTLDAAIAWSVLAAARLLSARAEATRSGSDAPTLRWRLAEGALLLGMLAMVAGLPQIVGWGRLGFVVTAADDARQGRNLLAATEVPTGDWWDTRWVDVEASTLSLEGRSLTALAVTKEGSEAWLRLQQLVRLAPGTTYTLSGWIEETGETVPGFQGWGRVPEAGRTLVLLAALSDGDWTASVLGPGQLVGQATLAREGAWRRVAVTFRTADDVEPITWFVGFAPDARPVAGSTARVAGLQLEVGEQANAYQPGSARGALPFGYARAPLWQVTWQAIRERPLLGWGADAFPAAYAQRSPSARQLQQIPGHPHNQALLTLFEGGVVATLGLLLLLAALVGGAVRRRDAGLLAVVLAVLVANTFDASLLSGGVLYPLAAVAGWRSRRSSTARIIGADGVQQVLARVALAAADVGIALLSLLVVRAVATSLGMTVEIGAAHLYALLLWPGLALREGLYPGYGLTAADELKRSMTASSLAAVVFVAATRLFPAALGIPLATSLAFALVVTVAFPAARPIAKRLLLAAGSWGRPVVVLGAGSTGRRVVRALRRSPLDGLHPVGLFDDDASLHGRKVEGVRVRGAVADAERFAVRHRLSHAVVAIPSLDAERLDHLTSARSRVFRRVQFVPRIAGIPSTDVRSSDLDGMLALEVKIGLASPLNRAIKRTFDVVAVVTGGLVLSPFFLGLMAAVYIDSPGPVFFGHTRIGRGGRRFTTWKFRSMVPDAERVLARHLEENPDLRAEWQQDQKLRDDPRVTRVGRFLRATSLDELPQIWNVMLGEMSLVGPRPIVDAEVPKYGHVFELYRMVRPGITGFWQVSGRNDVSYEHRVAMDAHYVRNWSVWLDLVILVRTVGVVLKREGAY